VEGPGFSGLEVFFLSEEDLLRPPADYCYVLGGKAVIRLRGFQTQFRLNLTTLKWEQENKRGAVIAPT
jgi:hypothetical protein